MELTRRDFIKTSAVVAVVALGALPKSGALPTELVSEEKKMGKKIIDALNKDREGELGAIIQYMKHHYEGEGIESPAILETFKSTAKDEMKHAEKLGERIVYLGGTPTKKPEPIVEGGDLKKMIQDDLAKENAAIKQYKEHIKLAIEEDDPTTRLILEKILSEEEGHADTWQTILGIK